MSIRNLLFGAVVLLVATTGVMPAQTVYAEETPAVFKGHSVRSAESTYKVSDAILPHLAMGGGWETVLVVTNMTVNRPSKTYIDFFLPDGNPTQVSFHIDGKTDPVAGSRLWVTLPPGGTMRLVSNPSPTLRTGWAQYEYVSSYSEPEFGGMAAIHLIFRQKVPGRPEYESVVAPDSGMDASDGYGIIAPFNNENGFGTAVALANSRSYPTIVFATLKDPDGVVLDHQTVELAPHNQIAFQTADRWPVTQGRSGTITLKAADYGLGALTLLFGPTGTFTTSLFYETTTWQ